MSSARVQVIGAVLALALFLPACGPSVQAPRVDDADYIFPEIKRGEMTARDEKMLHQAWSDLMAGQVAKADSAVVRFVSSRPDFGPARDVLGFARLRENRLADAEAAFGPVVASDPNDVSAIVGLASVRRKQGRLDEALPLYVKAERLRPKDAALGRRASEVKLAVAEGAIAKAGSLSAEGHKAEAIVMLQRALEVAPELSPVRLELADLLVEAGRRPEAVALLAAAPEPDRSVVIRLATMRFEDGDLDGAEMSLKRGIRDASDDPDAAALLSRIKDQRASLALPEPLRAIGDAPRITRAELAALVVEKVSALRTKNPAAKGEVASDLSKTWARAQVLRALDLGLMDLYPNHTFQPSGVVRRGELAVVAARVLDLVGWGRPNGPPPKDMSPSHLQYSAVVRVAGAGVMQYGATGAFEPWRIVTGAEAKTVVEALTRLASAR